MKKKAKISKITIDKLAIMVNNGFESLQKGMNTGFEKVEEQIVGIKHQLEGTNKRIDALAETRVKYEDHNKLKLRVDAIEKDLK